MTEDILKYADVFSTGMRIEVELPLADEKQFRDDAEIVFVHQDLLVLQLTRELFPEAVILETGTEIHLRTGKKEKGYRCRAILLNCDGHSRFKIRLVGEMIPFNDREFFRIDVFIPLAYRPRFVPGRWVTKEAQPEIAFREYRAEVTEALSGATPEQPLPVAANLSGTGVRINIPERFEVDALLDLTLHLPFGAACTMTLVGQVVHVVELGRAGDPHPLFTTSLHFISLDDAQREALVGFIQRVELQQIRRLREPSSLPGGEAEAIEVTPLLSKRKLLTILWTILSMLVLASIVFSIDYYSRHRTKGEIERTFEEQIQKIIERK